MQTFQTLPFISYTTDSVYDWFHLNPVFFFISASPHPLINTCTCIIKYRLHFLCFMQEPWIKSVIVSNNL